MMNYRHADTVLTITSPDGRRELNLLARHDGLFEFREYVLTLFDHAQGPEEFWIPCYSSGLFQTQAEAKREADIVIDWLRPG